MNYLNKIFRENDLTEPDVRKLSEEAKFVAVGCGKQLGSKTLSKETWSLLYNISNELWDSHLSNKKKITLSFQLFELFPSYYHFLNPIYLAIINDKIVEPKEKNLIWNRFIHYLNAENYYADPVGYILWVEFFEGNDTVREAWSGLMNCHPDKKTMLHLLELAGPVPYELKEITYQKLIPDRSTHEVI